MRRAHRRRFGAAVLLYAAVLLLLVVVLFPFVYAALSSFRPVRELFSTQPVLLPEDWTGEHYRRAFNDTNFPRYFRNSMVVALATVVLSVVAGTFAGYSLARLNARGRNAIATGVLLVYLLPGVLLLIPLYLLIVRLGLADSPASLILAYTTFAVPFTTWLLRAFFVQIPRELEEASLLDGSTVMGAFRRVVLPLSAPGIVSAAVFAFILAWNEVLFALTFISSDEQKTIPVGIAALSGEWSTQWGTLLAVTVVAGLPVLLFFTLLNRYLLRGLTAGAVKG